MMKEDSLSNKQFKARDINKILGIDKNKLFYWIRTHRLLKPEIEEARGIGTRSKFSLKNLLELATVKEMLKFGFSLDTIKLIKNQMDKYQAPYKNIFYYFISSEFAEEEFIYIYRSGKKFEIDLKERQLEPDYDGSKVHLDYSQPDQHLDLGEYMALRLEMGKLARELNEKIMKY